MNHGDRTTGPLATFALQKGPGAGTELFVRLPMVSIGKGAHNDVVLDDDSVSTRHAELEYVRGGWRITDLGSANGTFVESVRLAPEVPTPLSYGSTIRFGAVQAHFRPVPGADPASARELYVPPVARPRVAERNRARVPFWFVLLLLVLIAAALVWYGLAWTPEPGPTPLPEGGTIGVSLTRHAFAPVA
jgi:hypothetical protein